MTLGCVFTRALKSRCHSRNSRLTEAGAVLPRNEERLDHLGLDEIAVELIELRKPEIQTVEVIVGRIVRVAAQVSDVLHVNEGPVKPLGGAELYKVEQNSLRKFSDRTGGRAFFPRDDVELRSAFAQIQEELRSQYVIAYSPQNKLRDGSHRRSRMEIVNSELRKQKLQLIYRQGYYAPKQ